MNTLIDQTAPIDPQRLGGKASALARLSAAGLAIPDWFVVEPAAFEASLRAPLPETEAEVAQVLDSLAPSAALRDALKQRLSLAGGGRWAVRSSALDEDGAQHSFAGQLESWLNVPAAEVAQRVADVWRSGFAARVWAYRREAGLPPRPQPPAVLVQRMIEAEAAGVAFAADPVSGRRDVAVVSAVHGLGTALVGGEADADTWRVDAAGSIIEFSPADTRIAHRCDAEAGDGLRVETLSGVGAPLSDAQVREVAALARAASQYFARPQDIEWALADGTLYLLQSRPITALDALADPCGERNLWDNSNIAESYGGITTPLTFSFAHTAYASVYREFCRILHVPESAIRAHDTTFRRMLGLVRGRVYYNLLSWYRVLALLPGFTMNRRFMEQMMGVREGLSEDIAAELAAKSGAARLLDGLRFSGTLFGLLLNHLRLPGTIRRFYRRLDEALGTANDLTRMDANALVGHYHALERRLLTRWDAPLINDFFAMLFYGVLRKLAHSWCGDSEESLQNDLLAGEGGMISAEPARRLREMATMIADDEALVSLLCAGQVNTLEATLIQHPDFAAAWRAYLDKFGDRCLDELKLESATLHDDPQLLMRSVGLLARHLHAQPERGAESGKIEQDIRARAEARVAAALAEHPLRRRVFGWVLAHARARVRDRENLRFERTRLFGRVRRVFVELGKRLFAEDRLDEPRDVFYLTVDELLGFVEGTAVTTDLRALVALRRAEFARYAELPPPADRFETLGMIYVGNAFRASVERVEAEHGDTLKGIGCCPGVVRGQVRVVRDPREATLIPGEILVAERTDPGWVMLFPAAAGLLVERGSLLSHSAIVAREMGIPAVVSVPGLTAWLRDGDWVEFDGATGVIRRLEIRDEPETEAGAEHEQ